MHRTCGSCCFWAAPEADHEEQGGECRFEPPRTVATYVPRKGTLVGGMFPSVARDSWCRRWTEDPKERVSIQELGDDFLPAFDLFGNGGTLVADVILSEVGVASPQVLLLGKGGVTISVDGLTPDQVRAFAVRMWKPSKTDGTRARVTFLVRALDEPELDVAEESYDEVTDG